MTDEYWEKNIGIKPQPVSDTDVWRAAKQIIDRYPEEPELAACLRADAALDQGDRFNFDLWQRIAKAVTQLLVTPPADPKSLN
jgi:hypothetical protein